MVLLFLWKKSRLQHDTVHGGSYNIKGLLEVAEIEGAGRLIQVFQDKAALPFAHNTVCYHLSMINSFKVFREVYMLTGSYPFGKLYMLQHFYE